MDWSPVQVENGYPIRSEYNYLMRDLFYKGMGRLRSRMWIKIQRQSGEFTSPDKRSGDLFSTIFFDFFAHGVECEEKPEFTTEICYGVEQVCFLLVHYEVETNIFDI
jgi:hypothetical protein